jgi:hypothetical protein
MEIIRTILTSVPVVVGIALVAISLGGRWTMVTGIVMIIVGLILGI